MKHFDVAVIGGGVLGCFTARALRQWNLSAALLEAADDVCTGITRANSAIIYAGYDNQTGSLKAELTVRGNAAMDSLCEALEVPFHRCGSLLVTTTPENHGFLEKKLRHGRENGVPGLQLLTGQQARELEPMLAGSVTAALYSPTTGTVNPWQLGIAAYENAVHNGCEPYFNTKVLGIARSDTGYVLQTNREELSCRAVINCAGLYADQVQELLFPPSVRLHWDAADYLVLDERTEKPGRILFHQADRCGKGITAIPTTEGNLLLSGVRRPLETPYAVTADGLNRLHTDANRLLPGLDLTQVIRSFGAVRPNPYRVVEQNGQWVPDGSRIGSFCIENPAPGFFSLMGIKTPGLTCADQLGQHIAAQTAAFLQADPNPAFDPRRKAILNIHKPEPSAEATAMDPDCGEIICLCGNVTKAEVLEAIRRGAAAVDGIKRRTGCGMGRCQGSRCSQRLEELLQLPTIPLRGTL